VKYAIVGRGRIGLALEATHPKPPVFSGRTLLGLSLADFETFVADYDHLVHVAGPAGEAICLRDPTVAFDLHYRLTERLALWAQHKATRHLTLLSTVAPDVGFYGPLKRAAVRMAQRLLHSPECDQLTVIEAGHVVGKGMSVHQSPGVVARFIAAAMLGEPLAVPDRTVLLRFTPLATLRETVLRVVQVPIEQPPMLAPVSAPTDIREVAALVARLVGLVRQRPPVPLVPQYARRGPDYTDPLGDLVPVRGLAETIMEWLRTPEVHLLHRGPSGRVLTEE
jgi:nucleoside-diphosphate-sugar epimerase